MEGMVADVTVAGQEDLIRLLLMAGASAGPLMGRLLKEEADDIFRESQEQVPFRDGPLKASGRVGDPVMAGSNDWLVEISYGSTAVAYALYQHEGMRRDGSHVVRNYSYPGKKKHYLIDPVEQHIPDIAPHMALKLQEILDHG
jgi:hypothetical protein